MKKKIFFVMAVVVLLFAVPGIGSLAAGATPLENGWGNSTGRIVYQQEEGTRQVVFDTADLQKLYELAK